MKAPFRMLRSLYWRLSLTFLLLLLILGVAYVFMTAFTARRYFQETNQKLNAMVAGSIASHVQPISGGVINRDALKGLFDNAMVINPSVEVYLLDPEGTILAYSAPDSLIKRTSETMGRRL